VALRAADDEPRKRALYQVIQGVDRGTHLIQQLLTLSRIEAGVLNVSTQQVDLPQVAAEVLSQMAQEALEKGIDLELTEGSAGKVRGDVVLLHTMLRNLVDNAIRYTPEPGSVTVNIRTVDDGVLLEVTDSGPGIPADQRQRVFDRFYRILGTNQKGSGLGLSIVKRIAVIHGADIAFDSGPGDKGLVVRVRFKS
jgi:two-component system sensor histidine kinase QseC